MIHDETQRNHTRWDFSVPMISPTQRPPPDDTQHSQETSMPTVGFEPAIPASERRQTDALDGAATRVGNFDPYKYKLCFIVK